MMSQTQARQYEVQLREALEALSDVQISSDMTRPRSKKTSSLIAQCLRLSAQPPAHEVEAIRTVHHLSCVGGTLIAKCIATMSNVLLLNELDFYSELTAIKSGNPTFSPTDMVSLLHQGNGDVPENLISKLLLADLKLVKQELWRNGRSLVVRDHSHGAFLVGDAIPDKPSLHDLFGSEYPLKSIVTVRDPADSYRSMTKQGWHTHFQPSTFDEYARRYNAFLDKYDFAAVIKYEDFVLTPKQTMRKICSLLNLRYFSGFEKTFGLFRFSGDSGRGGREIRPLPKLDESQQYKQLTSYRDLADRLGYDTSG